MYERREEKKKTAALNHRFEKRADMTLALNLDQQIVSVPTQLKSNSFLQQLYIIN